MATSTFNPSFAAAPAEQEKSRFFARFAEAFIAHRTATARRLVAEQLSCVSDQQLAASGWTAEEVKRLRKGM